MLSTFIYAILTYVLVKETIKMREIQTEPKIQIVLETFETTVNSVRLNIKNIGQGPAIDIVFKPSIVEGNEDGEKILKKFLEPSSECVGAY
jgi:hypothetical protein